MHRSLALGLLWVGSWCSAVYGTPFSKVFVFGDSLSDNGNTLAITSLGAVFDSALVPRPKLPWYSKGRWTNGTDNTGSATNDPKTTQSAYEGVWHEHLATKLGLAPAKAKGEDTDNTNYAYGGATTAAGGEAGITHVGGQLDAFLNGSPVIADSHLFLTWAGGNDLRDAAKAGGATVNSIKAAATTALNNMKGHLTRLADAGVKHIIWPNLPPLHLVPEFLGSNATIREGLEEAAKLFRRDQDDVVDMVRSNHIDTEITIIDVYGLFLNVSKHPANYGYTNHTQGIINVPDFSAKAFAPTPNFNTQEDPDKYVFWDQLHPTARTHELIATRIRGLIPEPATLVLVVLSLATCGPLRAKRIRQ